MNTSATQRRCGMTLLEVMISMAVLTALTAVTVRLLDSVLRMQHAASRHAQAAMDLNRLADALRRDAQQAQSAQIAQQGRQLTLNGVGTGLQANRQIRYTLVDDAAQRELLRGGEVTARDSFTLASAHSVRGSRGEASPAGAAWQWDADSGVVTLQLPSQGNGSHSTIRIEAVIVGGAADDDDQEATP